MFFLKLLFIIVVFYYLGKWLAAIGSRHAAPRAQPPQKEVVVIGDMVACAACGTYVAQTSATRRDGKVYCSATCKPKEDA